jgi:outer membrane lipoprotein-sorting protein
MSFRTDPSGTTGLVSTLLAARHPQGVAGLARAAGETLAARARPDLRPGAARPGASPMKPPPLALAAITAAVLILAAVAWTTLRRAPGGAPSMPALSADELVARVAEQQREVDHLIARASFQLSNAELHRTKRQDGALYLQRGGKLRWDVLEPHQDGPRVSRSYVSDGAELHIVSYADREILKVYRDRDPVLQAAALLTEPLPRDGYTATLLDPAPFLDEQPAGATYAVALTPRPARPDDDASSTARAPRFVLVIDATDFHLQQIHVDDGDNQSRLQLLHLDSVTPPRRGWFELDRQSPQLAGFRFVDASM